METTTRPGTAVRLLERMLQEGFATGETAVVDEVSAPDLVEHQFGLAGTGEEAIHNVKQAIQDVHRAFPDLRFTILGRAEEGDTAWIMAEGVATNTGPFIGRPTGRQVRFTVFDVARVVDGRIVEHWGVPDRFAILAQIGALGAMRG
jgi:predicted ester cyclase